MDAIGNGPLPQYSAFCVVWLYNEERKHLSAAIFASNLDDCRQAAQQALSVSQKLLALA